MINKSEIRSHYREARTELRTALSESDKANNEFVTSQISCLSRSFCLLVITTMLLVAVLREWMTEE